MPESDSSPLSGFPISELGGSPSWQQQLQSPHPNPGNKHPLLLLFPLLVSILIPQQDAEPKPSLHSRLEAPTDTGGEPEGEGSCLKVSVEAIGERGTPTALGRSWSKVPYPRDMS